MCAHYSCSGYIASLFLLNGTPPYENIVCFAEIYWKWKFYFSDEILPHFAGVGSANIDYICYAKFSVSFMFHFKQAKIIFSELIFLFCVCRGYGLPVIGRVCCNMGIFPLFFARYTLPDYAIRVLFWA